MLKKYRMRTRNCLLIAFCFIILCGKLYAQPTGSEDRMYWVQTLTKIADPVLVNLSHGTLKRKIPSFALWSAVSSNNCFPLNRISPPVTS